jgi:RNA polymerase sigma factor (sigma-70 family)
MPDDESDATLIAESIDDPQRFAAIFDRHFASVYAYINRCTGRSWADEVAADVFLIAFQTRDRYDPLRPVARPWLFGIATNLIARRRRSAGRQSRAYGRAGAVPDLVVDEYAGIDARVDAERDAWRLQDAIAAMNDADRDVLLLFAWEGLGYDDIATALAVPVGTVKSRLHRARRVVGEHLMALRAIPSDMPTTGEEPCDQ